MSLLFISFLAGLLTVLAPCILPLLPVVVGGSLDTRGSGVSLKRALVVTASLSLSIVVFTLLLKVSTIFIDVRPEVWGYISGSIIILFGLVSLFPYTWESIGLFAKWNAESNQLLGKGIKRGSVWGDVIVGAALGPVFSTCSPTYFLILATVLPVSLSLGVVYLGAYVLGLSIALIAIAYASQRVLGKLGVAADPHGVFKRLLGLLFVLVGIAVATGYDKRIEAAILTSGFFDVTSIEQRLIAKSEMKDDMPPSVPTIVSPATPMPSASEAKKSTTTKAMRAPDGKRYLSAIEKAALYKRSAELVGIDGYINTNGLPAATNAAQVGVPIKIADYRGKAVVLVDIWTYSCINCQRTLPYVTSWYGKYKDKGLVVIGVHTPEFAFEKVQKNVEEATKRFGIDYPVVLDNDYATWNAFGNHYWPRKYLVDVDGYIVYDHAGEGAYDEAEKAIQDALMELAARKGASTEGISTTTSDFGAGSNRWGVGSPETYFGSARNDLLGNGERGESGVQTLTEPLSVDPNTLYLIGKWNITPEYAEPTADVGSSKVGSDRIDYLFAAKHLYLVAGAKSTPVTVEVTQDGKPLDETNKGKDVFVKDGRSYVTIGENRLYDIVSGEDYRKHLIELIVSSPGLEVYTFTFG